MTPETCSVLRTAEEKAGCKVGFCLIPQDPLYVAKHALPACSVHQFLKFLFMTSSVQSLSRVRLFATPWTAARQTSLSITNSQTLLKLMAIEWVMPSNYLIFCRPLLLLPSVFPSIRVSSNESVLHIRWPEYWSFSFSISPSSEYAGLISFRTDWFGLLAVHGTP